MSPRPGWRTCLRSHSNRCVLTRFCRAKQEVEAEAAERAEQAAAQEVALESLRRLQSGEAGGRPKPRGAAAAHEAGAGTGGTGGGAVARGEARPEHEAGGGLSVVAGRHFGRCSPGGAALGRFVVPHAGMFCDSCRCRALCHRLSLWFRCSATAFPQLHYRVGNRSCYPSTWLTVAPCGAAAVGCCPKARSALGTEVSASTTLTTRAERGK